MGPFGKVSKTFSMDVSRHLLVGGAVFVLGLEFVQLFFGEGWDFLVHVTLSLSLVTLFSLCRFSEWPLLFLVTILCLELASWMTVGSLISFQVIDALDLEYILSKKVFVYMGLAGILIWIVMGVSFHICRKSSEVIGLPVPFVFVVLLGSIDLIFVTWRGVRDGLYPLRCDDPLSGTTESALARSFEPARCNDSQPRSLILIQLEEIERESIGWYNHVWPEVTPFLSEVVRTSLNFANLEPQRFANWTASSILISQCGWPQILRDVTTFGKEHSSISRTRTLTCIDDYMNHFGFRKYAFISGTAGVMGIKAFFKDRGFTVRDVVEMKPVAGSWKDYDLFHYLGETFLSELLSDDRPFFLRIVTEDTHVPYHVDKRCVTKGLSPNRSYPRLFQSINCLDRNLEWFFDKLERLNITNRAEVVIYGDHIDRSSPRFYRDRKNIVIFPFIKQRAGLTKQKTSIYDLPATFMDLLKIECLPGFPFGSSLFSIEEGRVPEQRDLEKMYSMLRTDD